MSKKDHEERCAKVILAISQIYDGLPHNSKRAYTVQLEIALAFVRNMRDASGDVETSHKTTKTKT